MDPSNIYAANGMGIMMAETGKYAEAKDFFVQVGNNSITNHIHIYISIH